MLEKEKIVENFLSAIQKLNIEKFGNIFQIDKQTISLKDTIFRYDINAENQLVIADNFGNELLKLQSNFSESDLEIFLENVQNDRLYFYYKPETERITIEEGKRSGQPCIRGMRFTVGDVLDYLGSGMTFDEILYDFPELEREDIVASLNFAIYLIKKTYAPQTL